MPPARFLMNGSETETCPPSRIERSSSSVSFFFSISIQFKRKDAVEVNATNIGHTKQTHILFVIFIEGLFTFQQLHPAALKSARMQTPQENISFHHPKTHQYVCETENMTTEAPVIPVQIIMVVLPEVLQLPPLACAKYHLCLWLLQQSIFFFYLIKP